MISPNSLYCLTLFFHFTITTSLFVTVQIALVFQALQYSYPFPLHLVAPHRFLKITIKKASVPLFLIHDLKHTHAILMLQAGEYSKIIQGRLGRSSIQMALDKYSHIIQNMRQQVAKF